MEPQLVLLVKGLPFCAQVAEDSPDQATNAGSGVSGSGTSDGSILPCALLQEPFTHQSTSSREADGVGHGNVLPSCVHDSTSPRRPLRKVSLDSCNAGLLHSSLSSWDVLQKVCRRSAERRHEGQGLPFILTDFQVVLTDWELGNSSAFNN